jgi:hypothetical protein
MNFHFVLHIPGKGVNIEMSVKYVDDRKEAVRVAKRRVKQDFGVEPEIRHVAVRP